MAINITCVLFIQCVYTAYCFFVCVSDLLQSTLLFWTLFLFFFVLITVCYLDITYNSYYLHYSFVYNTDGELLFSNSPK